MKKIKNKVYSYSIIITVLVAIAKVIGIIRDSLIAKNFGLTYVNDIYMFALGTTMLIISLGYGLTTTLIPIHSKIIITESEEYRKQFANSVINIVTLITVLIVFIGYIFTDLLIIHLAPSFLNDAFMYQEAKVLIRIMFLSLLFVAPQSVISAINQSHKQFVEAASMSIYANVIYIIYLLFFIDKYGLFGFGFATVIGFFLMLFINIPKYRKLGYKYKMKIDIMDRNLRKLFRLMVPVILSSSLIQINLFIVRGFAGRLEYGSISSLDYANKLNMMVYEIFAVAINMAIYPLISGYASSNNIKEFKESFNKGITLILLIMIPCAVGVFILREPIITLYLKRGEFGEREVAMTSNVLMYYLPTMIAYGTRELINRAYYSFGQGKEVMINSTINILLTIILCAIFVTKFKAPGLAIANTIAIFISNVILYIQLNRKVGGFNNNIGLLCLKLIISSTVMGIVVQIINKLFLYYYSINMISALISILICAIIGILIYFLFLYIFRIKELNDIISIIVRTKKKKN